MRASMDSSFGGGGGMSSAMMYGAMGMMGGNTAPGFGGGMADFGSQIRPVTYTPAAIAMTPHFGMYQVQQTLGQAGLATFGGPIGAAMGQNIANFRQGGLGGLVSGPNAIPNNITASEYVAMSARGFGDRAGDAIAVGGVTAASIVASTALGGAGYAAGASLFSGGVGKMVGGLIGGALGGAVVSAYTGAVTDMMAENRGLQNSLAAGSFRFFNGVPGETDVLTGRGMGRRTRASVATSIQSMEQNDLRFDANDYAQILEGGMQNDLFSGTRDVEDFKTKFKGLVESLKTVTSTLHTSLKEGLEVVRGFRDMGVTDPSEVNRLVLGSETRGRASGRTGQEMVAIGQAGAEIFRGTGVSMERGFELNQMNATNIRTMLNQGTITRETVAQAGGENALAQQMTSGALSAMQTAHGRAVMMANFNPSTGQLNPNMMMNLAGGNMMSQIAGAASMGPAGLMSFQAHQEELISSMSPQQMQLMGVALDAGVGRQLRAMAGSKLSMDDAIRYAGQMRGLSKSQLDVELGYVHQDPEKFLEQGQDALNAMRVQTGMEDVRNRFNLSKRAGNFLRRELVAPVANGAMAISTRVGEYVDDVAYSMSGMAVTDSRVTSKNLVSRGQNVISRGGQGGVVDTTTGAGIAGAFGYGQTGSALGNDIMENGTYDPSTGTYSYKGGVAYTFKSMAEAEMDAKAHSTVYQYVGSGKNGVVVVANDQAKKMADSTRMMQVGAQARDAASKGDLDDAKAQQLVKGGFSSESATLGVLFGGGTAKDILDSGMSDAAFLKKHKQSRESYLATTERYVNTYGVGTGAARDLERSNNGKELADMGGRSSAELGKKAIAAGDSLIRSVKERYMYGDETVPVLKNSSGDTITLTALLDRDREAAAILFSGEEGAETAFMKKTGYSGNVHKLFQTMKPTDEQKALASSVAAYSKFAEQASSTVTGSTSGAGAAMTGDISKDTSALIQAQSAQLIENYKQLLALQEKLNAGWKKR